jgi:hypothetical protein
MILWKRRRTSRRVPEDTPCGWCFVNWATVYDHMVPFSRGGSNALTNLMPSCERCNNLLGAKSFPSIEARRAYVQGSIGVPAANDAAVNPLERLQQEADDHRRLLAQETAGRGCAGASAPPVVRLAPLPPDPVSEARIAEAMQAWYKLEEDAPDSRTKRRIRGLRERALGSGAMRSSARCRKRASRG